MPSSILQPEDRIRVTGLFAGVPYLRAVLDSALEGHLGTVGVDNSDRPTVAWLELGCYTVFGGDASAPSAYEWVESVVAPRELLCPDSDEWRRLLREVHGTQLVDRPMQAYSADAIKVEHLRKMARPLGGLDLLRMDATIAARLDVHLQPHALQVFKTPEDFAARGIGFAALDAGKPVCVASSYSVSRDAIELAIATHPAYRGRGLAGSVAATLMLHCLERGIIPHWTASNPVSQRLARRLGYRPDGICEIYCLSSPESS